MINEVNIPFPKKIVYGSIFLILLNGIDGALSLWGIMIGVTQEVNPLMRWLMNLSSVAFIIYKLAMPTILAVLFWLLRNRSRMLVTYGLGLSLIVYSVVMLTHAYWIVKYPTFIFKD